MSKKLKIIIGTIIALCVSCTGYYIIYSGLLDKKQPKVVQVVKEKLPPFDMSYSKTEGLDPLLRLSTTDGHFFCSAFVISDVYAITAAHCVLDFKGPFSYSINQHTIIAKSDSSDINITTEVKAVAMSPSADYALLKGDFRNYKNLRMVFHPNDIIKTIGESNGCYSCGYPWGGKSWCTIVGAIDFYEFMIIAKGHLFPGMSGGPYICITSNGLVAVGTNSAVSESYTLIAPLMELFANLGVEVINE